MSNVFFLTDLVIFYFLSMHCEWKITFNEPTSKMFDQTCNVKFGMCALKTSTYKYIPTNKPVVHV